MGLKGTTHWTVNYLYDYIIYGIMLTLITVIGFSFSMVTFTNTALIRYACAVTYLLRWR
jgi:hypothetical protein